MATNSRAWTRTPSSSRVLGFQCWRLVGSGDSKLSSSLRHFLYVGSTGKCRFRERGAWVISDGKLAFYCIPCKSFLVPLTLGIGTECLHGHRNVKSLAKLIRIRDYQLVIAFGALALVWTCLWINGTSTFHSLSVDQARPISTATISLLNCCRMAPFLFHFYVWLLTCISPKADGSVKVQSPVLHCFKLWNSVEVLRTILFPLRGLVQDAKLFVF